MSTTGPCSTYDSSVGSRGFALPPRYTAVPPFYHVVADLPLSINPSLELSIIRVRWPCCSLLDLIEFMAE